MKVSGWPKYAAVLGLSAACSIPVAMVVTARSAAADEPLVQRNVAYVDGAQHLSPGYTLSVVPVPPPPPFAGAVEESDAEQVAVLISTGELPDVTPTADVKPAPIPVGCPGELRAIIEAEEGAPFIILSVDGSSEVLRKGEGFKSSLGWVAVSDIQHNHAMVSYRGTSHRCSLSDTTR